MKTVLHIKGTHCKACKMVIEDICSDYDEITSCTADYTTGKTVIEHNKELNIHALKKEIEEAGTFKI